MIHRLAASLALVAFAVCLVVGGLHAGNPFSTTVLRALVAMGGMYVIGLVIGWIGQKMLDENLKSDEEKLKNGQTKTEGTDR